MSVQKRPEALHDEKGFQELLDYLQSIYPSQSLDSITENASKAQLSRTYILRHEQQIIGSTWVLDLSFPPLRVGGIGGVTVSSKFRQQGLGSVLINYALQQGIEFDAFLLWTRVPPFFESLGFQNFSQGIEQEAIDSTPMIWTRNPDFCLKPPHPKWERIKF
jgi:N-acetylglutamate synthase-like GNAT family acetyltransferase